VSGSPQNRAGPFPSTRLKQAPQARRRAEAALDAVRIRCRSRRTSPSARRQSTWRQSKGASSGPFAVTVMAVAASNLSSGSGVLVIFLFTGSPDRVSTLSRPGTRPGIRPVIRDDRLEEAAIVSRFPVAFPLPAFASRSSDTRRGVGPSSRSAYRAAPAARPDPDGVTTFRTHELRLGWVPSLPRGRRCSSRPSRLLDRRLPLCRGQSLYPASTSHRRGLLYEASTRIHAIHPSGLPVARGRPDGTGRRFGFPPSFAPRRPGAADARRGGDRPTSTDLELLAQHHIG